MPHPIQPAMVFALLLIGASGCDRPKPASPVTPPQMSSSERQQFLDAAAERERRAQNTEAPKPNITLATPPGWTRSEPRSLPPEDHGFTVAYEHDSGLAVTLYQFTRGLTSIPDDVNSTPVKEEMERAKDAIEQIVRLGHWQAAKEIEAKTIQLGDSPQQALWSHYQLKVDGMVVASDIYVWARGNTLFKLRCTCRSEDVTSNQAVLAPLLTALGSSDPGANEQAE